MNKKVTGIGGIIFKTNSPEQTRNWYAKHLGFDVNEYGSLFTWRELKDSQQIGQTLWAPQEKHSPHFDTPTNSNQNFMINYRVTNLVELIKELENNNIQVLGAIQEYPHGKFAHIIDIDGNKVELWEPNIT